MPGSINIAAGSLPDRLAELPRDHPIVTICAAGLRAGLAASILRSSGFDDVSWVASGVPAWRAAGHPVVRGDRPTRPAGDGPRGPRPPSENERPSAPATDPDRTPPIGAVRSPSVRGTSGRGGGAADVGWSNRP